MAQTGLSFTPGIIAPGHTKVLSIPSIADITAPSLSELTSDGVDLTAAIVGGQNWSRTTAMVNQTSLGSRDISQSPGMKSPSGVPSLVVNLAADGTDLRGTFEEDDETNIVLAWAGIGSGTYIDIWPVVVANIVPTPDFTGANSILVTTEFAAGIPAFYVAYPAS